MHFEQNTIVLSQQIIWNSSKNNILKFVHVAYSYWRSFFSGSLLYMWTTFKFDTISLANFWIVVLSLCTGLRRCGSFLNWNMPKNVHIVNWCLLLKYVHVHVQYGALGNVLCGQLLVNTISLSDFLIVHVSPFFRTLYIHMHLSLEHSKVKTCRICYWHRICLGSVLSEKILGSAIAMLFLK